MIKELCNILIVDTSSGYLYATDVKNYLNIENIVRTFYCNEPYSAQQYIDETENNYVR